MKTELKKKRQPIDQKPMKRMTLNVIFRDYSELADLFSKVKYAVRMGYENYSKETPEGMLDLRIEYCPNFQYDERVINGEFCYVYKSKA